jgi:circadian clock protein KaiC
VMQRYIEFEGKLRRVLSVVKVRGSAHSNDIRFYDVAADGLSIGAGLDEFQGILSGKPTLV